MSYRKFWIRSTHRSVLLCASLLLSFPLSTQSQTGADGLPEWLSIGFEQQSRVQVLDGQFRAGLDGGDQGFEWRNALTLKADFETFSVETEIADMRSYFTDEGSPLDSTVVNPLDILQANVNIPVSDLFREGDQGFIKIGRFTMDQGSRRFVARNRFRNTINSFAGVHAGLQSGNSSLELFYTRPTQRRVSGDWLDNKPRLDKQSKDIFWGAYLTTPLSEQTGTLQLYLLGADERREQAANQRFDVLSTGARVFRSPAAGSWHYETEAMLQFGDAPALDALSAPRDHKAQYFHFSLGYSFEMPWQPALTFLYHYGSGDKDPLDNESNELDHLFGVPRPDFGPTGLYRAFQRVNTESPGLMLNLQPASNIDAYLRWQRPSLAEQAQGWQTTRYQHPGGLGETHLGDQLETRVRWHLLDNKLTVDGGYVWVKAGPYMDLVGKGNSQYFYLQTLVRL
ncbi:MAG: alginate export family protein [Pseudomonadales bacterium]|nr:alginate export family protein [Pseudomonadales bacterium]